MTTCWLLIAVVLVVASSQSVESQPTTGDDGQTSSEGELQLQLTQLQSYVKRLTENQQQLFQLLGQRQTVSDTCHGKSLRLCV